MQKPEELVEKITKEEQELDIKLSNLEMFMMSEDFIKISLEQKTLLEQQHKAMTEYKLILIKRAHRLNWEAGRDKAAAEIKKATERLEPHVIDAMGYEAWKKKQAEEKDCKDCANSIDEKICTGDKEHGWVDTTGEKKCFAPKEPEGKERVPDELCRECKYYNSKDDICTNRGNKDGKCWETKEQDTEPAEQMPDLAVPGLRHCFNCKHHKIEEYLDGQKMHICDSELICADKNCWEEQDGTSLDK